MTSNSAQDAFLTSLDQHRGILFKVAYAYCRDEASREDLVQEIVMQLWRAYPRYDGRASFSTWMYRIAVNVAISVYRSARRDAERVERTGLARLERLAAPDAHSDENAALLREVIDGLDALNRALMILYLDDRSYAEIADVLGITQTNVATKINRLKERLRRTAAAQATH
ncbi:MAG TPA: RNA polymerase sigma factor [Candidatus Cybelea sp.]